MPEEVILVSIPDTEFNTQYPINFQLSRTQNTSKPHDASTLLLGHLRGDEAQLIATYMVRVHQ